MRFLGQYDLNLLSSNVVIASLYFWTCLIWIVVHFLLFYFVELLCKHWKCYLIWSLSWWKLGWSNTTPTNAFIWSLWPCHSAHLDMLGETDMRSIIFEIRFLLHLTHLFPTFSFVLWIDFHCCWMILNISCSVSWMLSGFFWKVNALSWIFAFANNFFFFFTLIVTLYNLIVAYVIFWYNLRSDVFLFPGSTSGFYLFFGRKREGSSTNFSTISRSYCLLCTLVSILIYW